MNILDSTLDFLSIPNPKSKKTEEDKKEFDPTTLGPKKVLFTWEALSRPEYKEKGNKFNKTLLAIGIVIGLILIIMQEFFLVLLIASLVFISNVLSKTQPEQVRYEITNHGFSYAGKLYYWNRLKQFFFQKESAYPTLVIDLYDSFPSRLFVIYNKEDESKIKDFFKEHVTYVEEEPKTFLDKGYESIISKFNIEG